MEKEAQYAWVNMDWSKDCRDWIKTTFNWNTYPIITKLEFETGDENIVGGFEELKQKLLSHEE